METQPLHPLFVHLPLTLAMIMPLLSGAIALAWWQGWLPRRAWLIAAVMQALFAFGTFAAMQTGEQDEEIAERVVSHDHIHEHEEAAERLLWSAVAGLLFALGAAVHQDDRKALALAVGATLAAATSVPLALHTGEEGGELVYEHGAANAFIKGAHKEGAHQDHDSDHDSDHKHDEGHDSDHKHDEGH